jgi:hypothetical protein
VRPRAVGVSFFGWRVVATAAVVAAFGYGAGLYGPGVYLHALRAERGCPDRIRSACAGVRADRGARFLRGLSRPA